MHNIKIIDFFVFMGAFTKLYLKNQFVLVILNRDCINHEPWEHLDPLLLDFFSNLTVYEMARNDSNII